MRRRDVIAKGGAPSADLLLCFPHRAHLTVMPTKAICSPTRHLDHPRATPATQPQPVPRPHHRRSKSSSNGKIPQASPVLWVKTKHAAAAVTSEPTSPKVTCVGQIKVQTKNGGGANPCKGWQSVMHEIERIHKDGKRKKRMTWGETLGFNKDVMQFLTCLRSLKFNFRCFGNFPQAVITSDDEEEDDDGEEDDVFGEIDIVNRNNGGGNGDVDTKTFSKWYMVLQEDTKMNSDSNREGEAPVPAVPPPNALLLMRCRSAPAKSWPIDTEDTQCADEAGNKAGMIRKNLKILIEEEKKVEEEVRKKEEGSVTASYDTDYYRISSDVVQETWIVGGFRDVLSKSRSWKI
ncbi:hypothetical protein MLD38_022437 [Melastoma candidum]|uniref:Uncharacterized protein n=1 Tax=Melastoma candidum TaxID=119954 RepID=A0ACB9QJT0_9MYRT|nr:hypothetical protein MLD38_022437 [Melastoma candidum]